MLEQVIAKLEEMPKQGVAYDEKGRHGWRNPIRADTGPILEALVLANNPLRILEIGTAHGLSACYLGKHLQLRGSITTIEWDQETAEQAQQNLMDANVNAVVLCGDAMKVIETKLQGRLPFDMVFLDANKDGYLEQFELLQKCRLLAPSCLLIADNVIDRQKECQNFLDYMKDHDHVILQTECGLLVAQV